MGAISGSVYPAASGGTGVSTQDNVYPWEIQVSPFFPALASTGTWDTVQVNTDYLFSGVRQNTSNTIDDSIDLADVPLAAGTWKVEVMSSRNTNQGIVSVQFDGVEKGTVDTYGTLAYNVVFSVASISVTTTAKVRLRLKMTSKNASSTGYYLNIEWVKLTRTA